MTECLQMDRQTGETQAETAPAKARKGRLVHIDIIKIIAMYMVLFNHTGNAGFTYFTEVLDKPGWEAYLAFSVFIKIAVPLYFMCSGAFLLKRSEPYEALLTKRIIRFVLIVNFQ